MKEVVLDVANSPNLAEFGQFVGEIWWTDATIRASCCSCKLTGEFSPVNLSKDGKLIRAKNLKSLFSPGLVQVRLRPCLTALINCWFQGWYWCPAVNSPNRWVRCHERGGKSRGDKKRRSRSLAPK